MCYGLRPLVPFTPGQVADSAATAKVIDVTPTLSVAVSGTAQEAQVLTATPTLGTDSDDSATNVISVATKKAPPFFVNRSLSIQKIADIAGEFSTPEHRS